LDKTSLADDLSEEKYISACLEPPKTAFINLLSSFVLKAIKASVFRESKLNPLSTAV
jgi:hypothetical protein